MMKKILLFAAACIAFAACNKVASVNEGWEGTQTTDDFKFVKGQEITLYSCNGSDTKVSSDLDEVSQSVNFKWEEGDSIKVILGGLSSKFVLTSGAGTSDASFFGHMPESGSSFDVQYPYTDPDLSNQTYSPDNVIPHDMMSFKAVSCTEDTFSMIPQFAALRLNFWGVNKTLGKIVLTNISSEEEIKPSFALNIGGEGIALPETKEEAEAFFIVVPKENFRFSVEAFDKDGGSISKFTTTNAIDFSNGGIINMDEEKQLSYFSVVDSLDNQTSTIKSSSHNGSTVLYVDSDCDWTVESDSTWLTVEKKENKEGKKYASVQWTQHNDKENSRSAVITFIPQNGMSKQTIIFEQAPVFNAKIDAMLPSTYFGKDNPNYPDCNNLIVYIGGTTVRAVKGYFYLTTLKAAQTLIDNWTTDIAYTIISKAGYELSVDDLACVNEKSDNTKMWYTYWNDLTPETEYAWLVVLEDEFGDKYAQYKTIKTAPEPWELLGMGKFQDGFFSDFFTGLSTKEIDVEIYYSKIDTNRYAVKNPYGPKMLGDGWMFNLTPEALEPYKGTVWYDKMYEFTINKKDSTAYVPYQTLGFNYYGDSQGGMHPTYSATATATFSNNTVTISYKGAVLNVPKYGMAYANKTEKFKITMPSGSIPTKSQATSAPQHMKKLITNSYTESADCLRPISRDVLIDPVQ